MKENSLEATDLGFRKGTMRDRMFMVIDSKGQFVTGRMYPKLLKITPSVIGSMLLLSASDFPETVELDFQNLEGNNTRTRFDYCDLFKFFSLLIVIFFTVYGAT